MSNDKPKVLVVDDGTAHRTAAEVLALSSIYGAAIQYVPQHMINEFTPRPPKVTAQHIAHQGNKERARRLKRKAKEANNE